MHFGPYDKWPAAICVCVCAPDELLAMVKSELGSVKTPKSIDFVEQLPRSTVGKVLKAEIRKPYWGGQARAVN